MNPLFILVVDGYPIIRRGLRTVLEERPGWRICGEAASCRSALQKAKKLKPEIVMLGLGVPGGGGLAIVGKILDVHPGARILVLGDHGGGKMAAEVFSSGARGFALKSDPLSKLARGVEALAKGKLFGSPGSRKKPRSSQPVGRTAADIPLSSLTSREQQVLQLLAEGRTNRGAAIALGLSVRTVEAHRASFMRKLGLHSLSELIYYAVRHQIVTVNA